MPRVLHPPCQRAGRGRGAPVGARPLPVAQSTLTAVRLPVVGPERATVTVTLAAPSVTV